MSELTGSVETFEVQPNGDVLVTAHLPSWAILITRAELAGMAEASAVAADVWCGSCGSNDIKSGARS